MAVKWRNHHLLLRTHGWVHLVTNVHTDPNKPLFSFIFFSFVLSTCSLQFELVTIAVFFVDPVRQYRDMIGRKSFSFSLFYFFFFFYCSHLVKLTFASWVIASTVTSRLFIIVWDQLFNGVLIATSSAFQTSKAQYFPVAARFVYSCRNKSVCFHFIQ